MWKQGSQITREKFHDHKFNAIQHKIYEVPQTLDLLEKNFIKFSQSYNISCSNQTQKCLSFALRHNGKSTTTSK